MTIDLDRHLRRIKVDKLVTGLSTRPLAELVGVAGFTAPPRAPILVDTNVYINAAAGRLPPDAHRLVASSLIFHSEVCIAEVSTGVANADPAHPQWKARRDHYARLLERMPFSRIIRPDAEIWTEAGLIAGTLARVQHF